MSPAEFEIMKIIWRKSSTTAREIIEALKNTHEWKPQTVKTLINRLLKKKALRYEKEGRNYRYWSLVDKKKCLEEESKSFVNQLFDGATGAMLMHFAKSSELSPKDVAELKTILEGK
jgi:BlaI family penicillinase repressor